MFDKLRQMQGQCKWNHDRNPFVIGVDVLTLSSPPLSIRAEVLKEAMAADKNVMTYTADKSARDMAGHYTSDLREVLFEIKKRSITGGAHNVFDYVCDLLDELEDVEAELRQSWFDKSGFKFKDEQP